MILNKDLIQVGDWVILNEICLSNTNNHDNLYRISKIEGDKIYILFWDEVIEKYIEVCFDDCLITAVWRKIQCM